MKDMLLLRVERMLKEDSANGEIVRIMNELIPFRVVPAWDQWDVLRRWFEECKNSGIINDVEESMLIYWSAWI